jgi:DNA-binding transcriptional MerR regulator
MEPLLSTREVSQILGVPVDTLIQWRWRGVGPQSARIGRGLKYRRSDIERLIDDAFLAQKTEKNRKVAAV